jgi:hypothetical protein
MRRIFLMLFLMFTACGGPDEAPAPVEVSQEQVEQLWTWPEDAGPRRDLMEDRAACLQEIQSNAALKRASALAQLPHQARCMLGKGWVLRAP